MHKIWMAIGTLVTLILCSCSSGVSSNPPKFSKPGQVMVLSVSTDGNYAISTDDHKYAILWGIKNHTRKIISRDANIYSAYFIKHGHDFMWQDDKTSIVHVDTADGKELMKFKSVPTYGQVMTSNLKTYITNDENWNIYKGIGKDKRIIYKSVDGGFVGAGKLLNMTLNESEKFLVSSGYCDVRYDNVPLSNKKHGYQGLTCVTLWNLRSGRALRKFWHNSAKTYATISPHGKYVIAGDEDGWGFVWAARTGKLLRRIADITSGLAGKPNKNDVITK